MTPKEKAKELFDKYQIAGSQYYIDTTKKYVLIAVDQIILEQCKGSEFKSARYQDERIIYWQQVKQEIEKL